MPFKSILKIPLTLLLLAILASVGPSFFSLPERWLHFAGLATRLLVVLSLAILAHKILMALHLRYIASRETFRTYSGIIRIALSVIVYGLFLLIFLDTAGISITPLIASLGMGSVAVALALQETLTSLFSGIYLIADKPIRVGDFIRLESGEEGTVESISWRSVRIRLPPNNVVIVPNAKLAGSIITNYYLPDREMVVAVPIGVDYSSDLDHVEKVTLEVAGELMRSFPGGIPDFQPVLRYQAFGDSSINFSVMLRVRQFDDKAPIVHEFIKRIHRKYAQQGINIPFPTRTLFVNQQKP